MGAFRKMFNVLRSNKTNSPCDMCTMSDKSLASTYSGNTRPSTYSFCNNFDVSQRTSVMSTISDVSPINYASELSNWRQLDANTTMNSAGSAMMPGYYGQYGYSDPYSGAMPYQNSNYGYPLMPDNHVMPTDNSIFQDARLMGSENPLTPMSHFAPLSESHSKFPNARADTFHSSIIAIPLDKLKRMRAAKDLYNVLNYLDNDDSFLKKTNKSSSKSSKGNNKKLF